MDDQALLAKYVAEGNAQAFAELSRRYERLVNAAARRETADAHLAEDITQSTMIVLMRKAREIPQGKPLGPWLLRVAHYLAVDALRNQSSRRRHEQSASRQRLECSTIPHSTPWRNIEPVLDQALNALGEKDRTILVLRYLQEWSIEQVARELELSSEATRQRLSRALRRMRKLLAHRGIDDECLIPIVAPISFRRGPARMMRPQMLSRIFELLRAKAVVAIGAFAILVCGIALTNAALHRAPANQGGAALGVKSPTPPPMSNSRADSTVP